MKRFHLVSLAVLSIGLQACGGGEGGVVASAPPPVAPAAPVPSPSPAPSPSLPPVSTDVAPTTMFDSVAMISGAAINDAANLIAPTEIAAQGQATIGRDATRGYSITLPIPTFQNNTLVDVLRKVDFSPETTNPQGGRPAFVARQNSASAAAGGDNTLDLGNRWGLANAHFAALAVCNSPSGIDCSGQDPSGRGAFATIIYGTFTPAGDIPLSGSASYSGGFDAYDWSGSVGLFGSLLLRIDFANQAVSGSLFQAKSWLDDGFAARTSPLADFSLQGTLSRDGRLTGTVAQAPQDGGWSGSWAAGLFGPGAAEVAGVMRFTEQSNTNQSFAGSFGAAKQ